MPTPTFLYVASPYSAKDKMLIELRVTLAAQATRKLCSEGRFAFSPVAHGHMLEEFGILPYNFWIDHGKAMLRKAGSVAVLTIPGWEVSNGIQLELQEAAYNHVPVEYLPFSKYCDLAKAAEFLSISESRAEDLLLSYAAVSNRT